MAAIGDPKVQVVVTGSSANRRWWVAEQSLAGLLARGPFTSAEEAIAEVDRREAGLVLPRQERRLGADRVGRVA